MQTGFDFGASSLEQQEKFKAQGMYPTPLALADYALERLFNDLRSPPGALLEPAAGYGNFIIAAWNYWKQRLGRNSQALAKLVENTYAFENDSHTYRRLVATLRSWCRENKVAAKPKLYQANFLLDHSRISSRLPALTCVIGNPPWDEFTTRKHDNLNVAEVRAIRDERTLEAEKYKSLGLRNLYQAFLHEMLSIPSADLRISFVLPRQLLGDRSASSIRLELLATGRCDILCYRNKDEREFFFENVDANFEIVVLDYRRILKASTQIDLSVKRGRRGKPFVFDKVAADYTIPCPHSEEAATLLPKILRVDPLSSWAENRGIKISMGSTKSCDSGYGEAASGRTVKAFDFDGSGDDIVVVNKILPNSRRKLKAATLRSGCLVAESLVVIRPQEKLDIYYLLLMLNSKAVEVALHALRSNINLNIFRLESLPIPQPTKDVSTLATSLYRQALHGVTPWSVAAELLSQKVFGLSSSDLRVLNTCLPDHQGAIKKAA